MHFYRAYGQPDLPENYTFRVFGLNVSHEDNPQYSQALKNACIKHAGPKPPRPSRCPRCRVANPPFATKVCYKAGIAGAWNMICRSCNKVHVPNQPGPTDEALRQIEAVRARDHETYLERKAKKAKQRAKARAIPPKEDCDETRVVAGTGKPFGILNNSIGAGNSTCGAQKKPKREKPARSGTVVHAPNNCYMKGVLAYGRKSDGTDEKPRTVELVFWEDQDARVDQVPVQFEHELFLYEFEHFKHLRGVCLFERYAFEASLWCDLPWTTSPIYVAPEDDVIFIRAMGIRCRGFGRQLDRYQRTHGLALRPAVGIRAKVNIPPARHHWLVVWGPRGGAPEIHLVDLSAAYDLDDDARLSFPWAHLIADAPFLLIWRETETGWAAVGAGVSSGVLEAPLTLVANPAAETLIGSGEAIAWLEEWRMGGGPRSRASSPANVKGSSAKQRRDLPSDSRTPVRFALPSSSKRPPTLMHKTAPSSAPTAHTTSVRTGGGGRDELHGASTPPIRGPRTHKAAPSSAAVALAANEAQPSVGSVAVSGPKAEKSPPAVVLPARKAKLSTPPVMTAQKAENAASTLALPLPKVAHVPASVALPARKPEVAVDAIALPAPKEALDADQGGRPAIPVDLPAEVRGAGNYERVIPQGGCAPGTPNQRPRAAFLPQHEGLAEAHEGGAHAHKRPAPATSDNEIRIVDSPPAAEGHAAKKVRLSVADDDDDDDDIVAIDGPYPAKAPPGGASRKGAAAKNRSAKNHSPDSARGAQADEDVVIIENPSAAFKRSFRNHARAPAPSAPTSIAPGPSTDTSASSAGRPQPIAATNTGREQSCSGGSSDDEVEILEGPSVIPVSNGPSDDEAEIVEGASIVPKRRVTIVNGREVINLT